MKIIRSITEYRYLPVAAVALALTSVTGSAQTAQVAVPTLLLTEVSDTVLTATVGGAPVGTVTEVSPNHWTWDSGVSLTALPTSTPTSAGWMEPLGETGLNIVTETLVSHSVPGTPAFTTTFGLDITSDVTDDIQQGLKDGTIGLYGYSSSSTPNQTVVAIEFHDEGDSSTVPDVSSTLGLLAATISGCFALARFRQVRA